MINNELNDEDKAIFEKQIAVDRQLYFCHHFIAINRMFDAIYFMKKAAEYGLTPEHKKIFDEKLQTISSSVNQDELRSLFALLIKMLHKNNMA
jgi:hypothetical protein